MITPQHSTQGSPPDDLLAKLRQRLDHRWREVIEKSAIDPAVASERGYYLEKTKSGLERLGFKRSQQRAPAGTPVRLSVPPRAVPMMRDVQRTLYITEGDKKADALASVGECCISLQGVQCWQALEDWEEVKLYGREAVIAFDADVMVNPNVQKALQGLATFLRERGALVKYLLWPERYRGTKTGVDDYLANGGN